MPNRLLCLALLAVVSFGAQAQNKTLTFTNASPQKSIRLLDASTVSIATTGNLTAQCVLNGTSCADIGTVTNVNAPTVGLSLGSFSTTPDVNGAYTPGTTLTITASVANADVCLRSMVAGSPTDTAWSGPTTVPGQLNVQLNTPLTTYAFVLTCYNSAGSASATSTSVATGAGSVSSTFDCTNVQPPSGFTRSGASTWMQQFGAANFPEQNIAAAGVLHNTGNGTVYFSAAKNTYTSVQFTTPSTDWTGSQFNWTESQITGAPTAALPNGVYITISRCPGDFRLGDASITAQSPDQTRGPACKSYRYNQNSLSINYNQTGTTDLGTCGLDKNTVYYLNYVNANAADGGGVTAGEHVTTSCNTCGVALKEQ